MLEVLLESTFHIVSTNPHNIWSANFHFTQLKRATRVTPSDQCPTKRPDGCYDREWNFVNGDVWPIKENNVMEIVILQAVPLRSNFDFYSLFSFLLSSYPICHWNMTERTRTPRWWPQRNFGRSIPLSELPVLLNRVELYFLTNKSCAVTFTPIVEPMTHDTASIIYVLLFLYQTLKSSLPRTHFRSIVDLHKLHIPFRFFHCLPRHVLTNAPTSCLSKISYSLCALTKII